MDFEFLSINNLKSWNRGLLNAFWACIALSILAETGYAFLIKHHHAFHTAMFVPMLTLIAIMLLVELVIYFLPLMHDYLIILTATVLASVLIHDFSEIEIIMGALFLPLIISVFYFQKKKILFAFIAAFSAFHYLYFFNKEIKEHFNPESLIAIYSLLAIVTAICIGIMNRGTAILNHLKKTLKSRQDLLVKNIIMDRLSKIDPLTELYNHISFHEYLDTMIHQCENSPFPIHLALIDIDDFKKVNDSFGHRAGDKVLQVIAGWVKKEIRLNDFAARYGGEEFAVIFSEQRTDDVIRIAERIRNAIADSPLAELNGQSITVSVGLSEYKQGLGKEKFFHAADTALYQAKAEGKNRVVFSP